MLGLSSCFTGVESTPKITYKEEKKQESGTSAEEELAATFKLQPFSEWECGKMFYVTSPRISLALNGATPETVMPEKGDTIAYMEQHTVNDLTGDEIVELTFLLPRTGSELTYRTNATPGQLVERKQIEVPFTIDLTLVENVSRALKGKDLYIKSNLWFTPEGKAVNGRKFVKVTITNILPGNEIYPLMPVFTDDYGNTHAVLMSLSNGSRWMPREFPALFSYTNPKTSYPQISDATWQSIVNSRVTTGMTKLEASLALGSPVNIDRGHDHTSAYERWSYSDGVYLIFEDGLLTAFKQ